MRSRGFTLIELIVVIVIIGILSVGFTSLYTQSIDQYLDANRRSDLSATARLALERVSRELRDALPNSVRVTPSGNCVEFRPLATAQYYLDIPIAAPASSFSAITFPLPSSGSWSAAIMPLDIADSYDTSASNSKAVVGIASVSPLGTNSVQVNLVSANRFPRTSSARRFFVTGTPISFCVSAGELRRYQGYGVQATQPTPGSGLSGGDLLARNIVNPAAIFQYQAGTLERNALLTVALDLRSGDEQIRHEHEVLIRNVP